MAHYIARFRNVKGRWLVEREGQSIYGGQRIATARQAKYGSLPDRETGLYLYESYRTFSAGEIESLKVAPRCV